MGRQDSSALVKQQVKVKDNSEFKPVKLCLKIDLVSYPHQAEGLVNMIRILDIIWLYANKLLQRNFLKIWWNTEKVVIRSTFSFLRKGIILWIKLPWHENPANTYARHTETLDSCFNLIRSHQQCIPWSPPLEIKPATTDCSAETLQLSHQFI